MLRLFLSAPEVIPLVSLSLELVAIARAARARCFSDVVAQARSLLAVLCSEEAAAGALGAGFAPDGVGEDVLRLKAQPPLACAVWATWRKQTEHLIDVASEAGRHADAGNVMPDGSMAPEVASVLNSLRTCVETVIEVLIQPAGGGRQGNVLGAGEAWGPGSSAAAATESLLPRLVLERFREEVDTAGVGHATALLQDAEVHAGLDHRLPWGELVSVLDRSRIGVPHLLVDSRKAANLDWSFPVADLRQLMLAEKVPLGSTGGGHSPCGGLVRALTRARLAAGRSDPPLPQLFRSHDVEGQGFVQRAEFAEVLRGLRCALSPEERAQITAYFSPAGNPSWVCYPLFLHSMTPLRWEPVPGVPPASRSLAHAPATAWGPRGASGLAGACAAGLDAHARTAELEAENVGLREKVRVLTTKCAETSALMAQTPVQMVQRLQGEVASLEARIHESQAGAAANTRKAEITLRSELDVAQHEVPEGRRQLQAKDRQIAQYRGELEEIIAELTELKGRCTENPGVRRR